MVAKNDAADRNGGVDENGDPINVDPTKNVLDLVRAESKYQDGMREALERYLKGMRKADGRLRVFESQLQNWMRDAESKRLDQLADLRQVYEKRIADMLSESVRSTSSLVSTQLVQIQATFDARISKLEEFRWQSTGRSSVADPALASSLAELAAGLGSMQNTMAKAMSEAAGMNAVTMDKMATSIASLKSTGDKTEGRGMGRGEVFAAIGLAVVIGGGLVGAIMAFAGG